MCGDPEPEFEPQSLTFSEPDVPLSFADGLEALVKTSEALSIKVRDLADDVRVTLAIASLSGDPIQEQRGRLDATNFDLFRPRPDALGRAVERARALGLAVVRVGRFGVTVSGPAALIEEVCATRLTVQARARRSRVRSVQDFAGRFDAPQSFDLFVAPTASLTLPAPISDDIDNFVFAPPPLYFAPSADPPPYCWHGLDVADVRRRLNVPDEFDGAGVSVAMVDSGFFAHPYYADRGFDLRPTPTTSSPNPHVDDVGHGTAMVSNIFAVAPKVEIIGLKQSNPPQDALEDAADLEVDVISCSWGYDREEVFPILQATILDIQREGRVFVFAAGNGQNAWPASQPEILSVGGVYVAQNGSLEASNYASGFLSNVFPGRQVPDVCGLCGQRPKGIYFMMPTQPGAQMDRENAGVGQDETTGYDGWVGASGTSASAPQVTGVVALMIQKARSKGLVLSPASIRDHLRQTSVAITCGTSAMGAPTNGHPNIATGWGLVDAERALGLVV